MEDDNERLWLKIIITLLFLTGLAIGLSIQPNKIKPSQKLHNYVLEAFNSSIIIKEQSYGSIFFDLEEKEEPHTTTYAWTTGFNSVEDQTDSTPCVGAGGYICGSRQVVACPRYIPLGTWIKIDNKYYECLDRLNEKHDDRFDIFFDKDIQGALNYGKQYKKIIIYDN